MFKLEVIEPSNFPYCSTLLLVKKTVGTNCPMADFHQLNRATTFEYVLMPNPEAIFATPSKDNVFSKLDSSKGYWQNASNITLDESLFKSSNICTRKPSVQYLNKAK